MIVIVLIGSFLTLKYAVLLGLYNYESRKVLALNDHQQMGDFRVQNKIFTGYFAALEEEVRYNEPRKQWVAYSVKDIKKTYKKLQKSLAIMQGFFLIYLNASLINVIDKSLQGMKRGYIFVFNYK